jgi:hypothetical protein
VLVTFAEEDDALNALESLTMTLAADIDGVITWDDGWQFLMDHTEDGSTDG